MIKRLFFRFTRTTYTMDLRSDYETRAARAERYAKRNHTCGKRSVFGGEA